MSRPSSPSSQPTEELKVPLEDPPAFSPYPPAAHVVQVVPVVDQKGEAEEFNWCNLVTAVVSFMFCHVFGFIATVLAVLAHADHKVNLFSFAEKVHTLCKLAIKI